MLLLDLWTQEPGALLPHHPQPWEEVWTLLLKAQFTEEQTGPEKEGSLLLDTQLCEPSLSTQDICVSHGDPHTHLPISHTATGRQSLLPPGGH